MLGVDVGGLAWCSVGAQELHSSYYKDNGKGGNNQSMGGTCKSSDEGKGMFPHDVGWGTGKSSDDLTGMFPHAGGWGTGKNKGKGGNNHSMGGTGKSSDDGSSMFPRDVGWGTGKSSDEGNVMFPHDDGCGTGKSYGKSKGGRRKNKGGSGKCEGTDNAHNVLLFSGLDRV